MIKREQIYEAFDNGLIGLDEIIDISYNKAIDDAINEIVSVKSEVAEKEPYDDHLFTVLIQRQNEIIYLIQKLKDGGKNGNL